MTTREAMRTICEISIGKNKGAAERAARMFQEWKARKPEAGRGKARRNPGRNRMTDGNGRTGTEGKPFTGVSLDEEAERERLIPGVMRGDAGAVIEFLTMFGGVEWQL